MKKILFGLALLLLILIVFLFFHTARQQKSMTRITDLPWQITIDQHGRSTVFNQTLGKSTLRDFQHYVKREPMISMFRDPDGRLSVEALFEKVDLGGLIANVILKLDIPESELIEIEKTAISHKAMPSGAYELKLPGQQLKALENERVSSITYTPASIPLDTELIKLRFGQPTEIIKSGDKISHFLYPHIGLDIILNLNKRGKAIFQYVNPGDFDQIREKLYGVQRKQESHKK